MRVALEIKEGGFYKTRDGRKVGPMAHTGYPSWPWSDNSASKGVPCWNRKGWIGWSGGDDFDIVSEWSNPIESPIRTVTRRELVPGVYGRVIVRDVIDNVRVIVRLDKDKEDNANLISMDADELRSAAMVLSQLAEFLDEDKGDE